MLPTVAHTNHSRSRTSVGASRKSQSLSLRARLPGGKAVPYNGGDVNETAMLSFDSTLLVASVLGTAVDTSIDFDAIRLPNNERDDVEDMEMTNDAPQQRSLPVSLPDVSDSPSSLPSITSGSYQEQENQLNVLCSNSTPLMKHRVRTKPVASTKVSRPALPPFPVSAVVLSCDAITDATTIGHTLAPPFSKRPHAKSTFATNDDQEEACCLVTATGKNVKEPSQSITSITFQACIHDHKFGMANSVSSWHLPRTGTDDVSKDRVSAAVPSFTSTSSPLRGSCDKLGRSCFATHRRTHGRVCVVGSASAASRVRGNDNRENSNNITEVMLDKSCPDVEPLLAWARQSALRSLASATF